MAYEHIGDIGAYGVVWDRRGGTVLVKWRDGIFPVSRHVGSARSIEAAIALARSFVRSR